MYINDVCTGICHVVCIYTCTSHRDKQAVYSFSGVFLSLNGDIIPNHGYAVISDIGSTDNTALICHTNRPPTLGSNVGNFHSGGEWIAPDQTRVLNDVSGFARNRGPGVLRLYRVFTGTPAEGIYHCVIEDDTFTVQTVYVALYNSGRGSFSNNIPH